MRMPEPRSSRQLNQLATQLQGEAEISGVNASGTQISSRAFEMVTEFEPAGDQPQAIEKLVKGINSGMDEQLLLGVTGSGKTYTMAKVISECQRPTIIMAHNKTLAAQLYGEFKAFFPNNAVEYFVSYYDYYQPEAYVAASDTFIEKDSAINDHIDQMRLSATRALLERRDAIIVASYGTFSTGINIVNLYNIILASPLKSRIKNLQSIGRALRLNGKDKVATLFDISDD